MPRGRPHELERRLTSVVIPYTTLFRSGKGDPRLNSIRMTDTKEGIAVNRLFECWRTPAVRRFLKLSLPAILALGLAGLGTPARAQDVMNTPFSAYYSGQIATGSGDESR